MPWCSGHLSGRDQATVPLPSKVQAVAVFTSPVVIKFLQEFLGMVNFYNKFILYPAHLLQLLYDALRSRKTTDAVIWTLVRIVAFDGAKSALAKAAFLPHTYPEAPITLTTDVSDLAVGLLWAAGCRCVVASGSIIL